MVNNHPIQIINIPDPSPSDWFGFSVNANEKNMVVGTGHKNYINDGDTIKSAGAVYIYERTNNKWEFTQKLTLTAPQQFDFFGEDLSLGDDLLFVSAKGYDGSKGAKNHDVRFGAFLIYQKQDDNSWKVLHKKYSKVFDAHDSFSYKMAVDSKEAIFAGNGRMKKKGELNNGHLDIYEINDKNELLFRQVLNPFNTASDGHVESIFFQNGQLYLGSEENHIWQGGVGTSVGAIYCYNKDKDNNWQVLNKITPPDSLNQWRFGNEIKGTSNLLFVAASRKEMLEKNSLSSPRGMVDVFDIDQSGNLQLKTIIYPPDTSLTTYFGNDIAVNKDYLAVAAMGSDRLENDSIAPYVGAVYLYELKSGNFNLIKKFTAPNREKWDKFGFSIALTTTQLIVGSRFEDLLQKDGSIITDAGSVYVYELY